MERNSITRLYRPIQQIFIPITFGLLAAQLIGTLFVYLSNLRIFQASETIERAGFLSIPAGPAMASLNTIGPAIRGGLFFTLSIGIGLTLVTWATCSMWGRLFKRHPSVLVYCIIAWLGSLYWVNLDGLVLFPSLFCIFVPIVTAWITVRCLENDDLPKPKHWYFPVITLLLLTVLWATQLHTKSHIFISIRDHILLSNPVGRAVNDFYYRNTLYAAETFKSFNSKTLRTCKLENFANSNRRGQLAQRLIQRDILVLPDIDHPDLRLIASNGNLRLLSANGQSIETTVADALSDLNEILSRYSHLTDRYGKFRRMTFFGLLLGFPTLLFVLTFGIVSAGLALVMNEKKVILTGSVICLIIGILLFLPILRARPVEITPESMDSALTSDQWPQRVAALRFCDTRGAEIADHPSYTKLLSSPLVVERYWLARALAESQAPSTYRHLLTLLEDPHPNVVCQAFYALGKRGRRDAIQQIKLKLTRLDHWYAQWYGYRALRKLGWYQGQ